LKTLKVLMRVIHLRWVCLTTWPCRAYQTCKAAYLEFHLKLKFYSSLKCVHWTWLLNYMNLSMHSHNNFSEFLRGNDGGWIQTLGNKFQVSSGEVTRVQSQSPRTEVWKKKFTRNWRFSVNYCILDLPSVLCCCWLGDRKGIRPVKKLSGGVLAWLSVWSEVQTCIRPSWCHYHSLSLA